jgi:solute carrier family 25 carnitine/acylcarnitine transporter 20/29
MDILVKTLRKEGFFALYKGENSMRMKYFLPLLNVSLEGMASPLIGIAGVNSLLFASYGISRRLISPFPLSLKETALAGSMAGAANAILASPGILFFS